MPPHLCLSSQGVCSDFVVPSDLAQLACPSNQEQEDALIPKGNSVLPMPQPQASKIRQDGI